MYIEDIEEIVNRFLSNTEGKLHEVHLFAYTFSWCHLILIYTPGEVMKKDSKGQKKVKKVMEEFKEGALHSGSKKGPVVKNQKQAVAIALSEARKEGAKIPKKGKK